MLSVTSYVRLKQEIMEHLKIGLLLKLCLIGIITINCNAAVLKDSYQSQISTYGLYNASDNVVILNVTNFKSSVYGDTKGWLVEFYNSWCGFCFRFAPLWKAFANDVYGKYYNFLKVSNCKMYNVKYLKNIYKIVYKNHCKRLFMF